MRKFLDISHLAIYAALLIFKWGLVGYTVFALGGLILLWMGAI